MARPVKTKKKEKKNVLQGVVHIQSTFNNTIVTSTDTQGNAIAWASAGGCGFKGARKGTPFAAQSAAEKVAKQSIDQGMKKVEVYISKPQPLWQFFYKRLHPEKFAIFYVKNYIFLRLASSLSNSAESSAGRCEPNFG